MPAKNRTYVSLGVPNDLMRLIEDYHQRVMPYTSRTSAILRLVQRGLECEGYNLPDQPTTTQSPEL